MACRFALLCMCGAGVFVQRAAAGAVSADAPPPPLASSSQSPVEDDPLKAFRAPLLREGSTLVEARSRLRLDSASNWWMLDVENSAASGSGVALGDAAAARAAPPLELIVLPCTRLTEMERILEAAAEGGSAGVQFEVSGRIYVFRDRNYILPTHAAVISERPTRAATTPASIPAEPPAHEDVAATDAQDQATSAPVAEKSAETSPAFGDDSAEAIARSLEEQAGPLARSSGAARQPPPSSTSPAARGSETVGAPAGASSSDVDHQATLLENTAIVNRRGRITRDRSGGWLLVFDADATGLSDPPLRLLPCSLLESIEDYARRSGNNSPLIITGQVYLYGGQNHLLPTVYRIPRESSRLTP